MAWKEMKYKIWEIKRGINPNPFDVRPKEFDSVEEAVEELKTFAPLEPS